MSRLTMMFLTVTIYYLIALLTATVTADGPLPATADHSVVVHCTSYSAWLAPGFSKEDCLEAGDRFEYSDFARYEDQRLEFSNRGTRRSTRLQQMTTPRRYTIGTCTIVVALLWDFPDQPPLPPLPGEILPAGPFRKNVVISFLDLFNSAKRILAQCYGKPRTPIGWEALAEDGSIGVFVMATNSLLARSIPMDRYDTIGMESSLNLTTLHGNSTINSS